MKQNTTTDVVTEVWQYIFQNSSMGKDGDNYISQIVRETGYSKPTVHKAVMHLVKLGFAEKRRDGGKKLIVPAVDPQDQELEI